MGKAFGGILLATLGLLAMSSWPPVQAQTQTADAALRDRVLQLLERLDDPKPEARDEAQARLIKLGARVVPLLPEPASVTSKERKERLERIRAALRQAEEETNTAASRVTIQAKAIRLSEAIQQLQKQTGNAITDLREQLGVEVTNPAFDLDIRDLPFHEALDRVARLAEVSVNAFTGDGSIGITAGTPSKDPLIQYVGPFRVAFKQLTEVRDLQAGTAAANAQLEVAWEPRLRPMLLTLKSDGLAVKDDRDREVKPQAMMESNEVVLRPENPAAEMNLNLEAPDRSAAKLSSLRVKAAVTLPAGIKTFRFPSLAQENVTQTQGDVIATLQNVEIDEQVWKVNVELVYPGNGPAFESYRQGLFNNRIWLQKADGSRFEHNGGFSNTGSDGGKLGFEYLFVDAPGKPADYQLVYETPSKVVTIPLEFEFKNVPLP
jgi:sporulation protein YlmC with PRC-barrel domain